MSPADSPFAQLPAPGPHPATAELRAYAAGALAPPEQHRIEAHTLDCARCADLVDGFSMSDAATTDRAVAELRARLQARVAAAEPQPGATGWAWPRLAAAAALLAVVGGGIWGWEQRRETSPGVATARLETAAPAGATPVEPAPAPPVIAPDATRAATPEVAKAPAVAKSAEYATVAPATPRSGPSPRNAARRPLRRAAPALPGRSSSDQFGSMDGESAPDVQELSESVAVVAANEARESPKEQPGPAAAPAAKAATALPARNSADALANAAPAVDSGGGTASADMPSKKSKALVGPGAADKAVAARVRATPMPAAAAIRPAPVGGTPALREYVRRAAAEFQPDEKAPRLTGTVRIAFVVDADGTLRDLKVARGLRADYDAEALRIVGEGPAWQPGISGGRRAPLLMEVKVAF